MPTLGPVGHDDRLSLVEHLDELRSRLITCVLAFLACFALTYWQNDRVLDIVGKPLEQTQNLDGDTKSNDPLEQNARYQLRTGEAFGGVDRALRSLDRSLQALREAEGLPAATQTLLTQAARDARRAADAARKAAAAVPQNRERQPVTLGVAEPFVTTFTVAGYAALLLCLPILLFQAYAFVLPAFTPDERKVALPLMLLVPVLFMGGVAFGYFVALPRAVEFLQNFNDDDFDILVQARDYFRFSVVFLAVIGLLFQIPVGVLAVTRLGVVSTATLRKNRGYVLLALAVVAAVGTPTPDPVTMLLALAPLVLLFELSVQLARIFEPKDGGGGRWSFDDDEWDDHPADVDERNDSLA
ncbi:twin-arginine translocase subunit TatC [Conexibacter sp. SYSU D00693]|uniref:twin-arginine translocase subunit TatC n=1 Tax=Conexibacter sp. SYSU D00693 TaxID=2812560 RepID=UPI00196A6B6D|nr:twin-arginine translocase subunit TatC [Conexibacter sp. SYSU D00693]